MYTHRSRMLRQSIEEERRKLTEGQQAVIAQPCADDNELASFYENTSMAIIFMQRARQRLNYLERSAAAIASRPHTLCEDCGEEISLQRLAARPEALCCASCQAAREEEQNRLHAIVGAGSYGCHRYTT